MADDGKIVCILADFGHKKRNGNVNINTEGRALEIFNVNDKDIGKIPFSPHF